MHAQQYTESSEARPNFSSTRKLTEEQFLMIWMACKQDRSQPSRQLLLELQNKCQQKINISIRQLNRWRVEWNLNRPKGRPHRLNQLLHRSSTQVILFQPNLPCVGLHLFLFWLEQQSFYVRLLDALQQAIAAHRQVNPDDSFPLLFHRPSTLLHRFLALLLAPLFGIKKLTGYDVIEHPLKSLLGVSFLSSTLNQYLGQLERIDASSYLLPLLYEENQGSLAYIDGHMFAFWTGQKMHKGIITMLGRVMAGTNAVVSHNEHGHPLYFELYAPDYRLPSLILEYCQNLVDLTGIRLFIIDREINSLKIAQEFEQRGWGLLSMLDKNESDGFESFTYKLIQDGKNPIYRAKWKDREKRKNDPRHFVLMEKDDKILVYWATSPFKKKVKEKDWPQVYFARSEVQENGFKRMIAHGALNTNYGTKKIEGPDRHQARKKEKLEEQHDKAAARWEKSKVAIEQQKDKIVESEQRGHSKRLEQRQKKLKKLEKDEQAKQEKKEKLEAKLKQEEEPRSRSDRDFRKQRVMTFRTLLLEKLLSLFFGLVQGPLDETVSMDRLLQLFKRSGAMMEEESSVVYWMDSDELSKSNQVLLQKIAGSLNQMGLTREEKAVQVRLRQGSG